MSCQYQSGLAEYLSLSKKSLMRLDANCGSLLFFGDKPETIGKRRLVLNKAVSSSTVKDFLKPEQTVAHFPFIS